MSVATAHSASAVPPADETPATGGAPSQDEEFWVEPGAAEGQSHEGTSGVEVPAQSSGEEASAQPSVEEAGQPSVGEAAQPSVDEVAAQAPAGVPAQVPGDDAAVDAPVDAPVDAVDEQVARDAREFGVYARTGGWAFALKVARSVRPGGETAGETPKVSAKRFAELAGCSPERVMRYYKAWDKAADDGMVPHFEALTPGEEIDLPDSDVWLSYYSSRSGATSDRGTAITAAAEAEGIRPTKALEVAENPTALRAAILADPSTAQAARTALLDRLKEDPALQTELARDIARTDELKKAVASETQAASRIGYVRQIVENGQVKTPMRPGDRRHRRAARRSRAAPVPHRRAGRRRGHRRVGDGGVRHRQGTRRPDRAGRPRTAGPGAPYEVLQQPPEGDQGLRGADPRRRRRPRRHL